MDGWKAINGVRSKEVHNEDDLRRMGIKGFES